MSGFAFSHQFSQRWFATPTAIKHTIMQELADIHTLLQPETELESFSFQVDNLHEAVETLQQIEALNRAVSDSENTPFTTPTNEPLKSEQTPSSTNKTNETTSRITYTLQNTEHGLDQPTSTPVNMDTEFAQFVIELHATIDAYVDARSQQLAEELKAELHDWLNTTLQQTSYQSTSP